MACMECMSLPPFAAAAKLPAAPQAALCPLPSLFTHSHEGPQSHEIWHQCIRHNLDKAVRNEHWGYFQYSVLPVTSFTHLPSYQLFDFHPSLFFPPKYFPLPPCVCGFPLVLKLFPVWKHHSLLIITGPSFKQESKISPSLTEELISCTCPDFGDIYKVQILPLGFAVRIPGW